MSNFDNKPPDYHQGPQPLDEPKTQVLGLDMNNAGLVCYIPVCGINFVASIVFLVTEPKGNKFLRFHAIQSLALCAAYIVCAVTITFVQGLLLATPFLRWMAFIPGTLWMVATIGFIWQSIAMGLYARKGGIEKLPLIGELADRLA